MTTPTARAARGPAGGSGKITRDAVLAAALQIIDRDGADALSMRRLARALDRDPMILYRHAPGKAALLNGVTETVLARLQVDSADPDWAGQLRQVARRFRALALAHPHVVPLIVTRPLATPLGLRPLGTLRPLEDILALLTRAGFSGPDALHIYRALFGFLHGHILDELQELTVSPDETDDLLRLGLHRLPTGDFPLLRDLAPVLGGYDGAAELERGLDILLTGLTATLTPADLTRPPAPADPHLRRPGPHLWMTRRRDRAARLPDPGRSCERKAPQRRPGPGHGCGPRGRVLGEVARRALLFSALSTAAMITDWSRTSVSREAEPVLRLRKLEKACCWRRNVPSARIRGIIKILLRTPAIAPAISAGAAAGPELFFARTRHDADQTPQPKDGENPGRIPFSHRDLPSMTDHRVRHQVADLRSRLWASSHGSFSAWAQACSAIC